MHKATFLQQIYIYGTWIGLMNMFRNKIVICRNHKNKRTRMLWKFVLLYNTPYALGDRYASAISTVST